MSRAAARSSATVLGLVVTMMGAIMITLAGFSPVSLALGVCVLVMGLAATAFGLLKTDRTADAWNHTPVASSLPPRAVNRLPAVSIEDSSDESLGIIAEIAQAFVGWFKGHHESQELWLSFDRFVRDTLHARTGAGRIRCFHVQGPEHRLVPLADNGDEPAHHDDDWRRAVSQAIQTGRMHVEGEAGAVQLSTRSSSSDAGSSEAVDPLPAWIIPIRMAGGTCGVIIAGDYDREASASRELLSATAAVLELMWNVIARESDLRVALQTDRASGVLNRSDLSAQAERVLEEAQAEEEPVVLLLVGLEGVRRLDDSKQWDVQDWLMQQVGGVLRRRLRSDDIIGRFSDDRFVALLRRLDLGLGELIARKVLVSIQEVIRENAGSAAAEVSVRCGLALDGRRGFDELLGRACDALQEARQSQQEMVSGSARRGSPAMAGAHV